MDTTSQYQWVQLDDRDGYTVELRASRINAQSLPGTPDTVTYVDHSSRVIYATDWNEVQQMTSDYNYVIQGGDLVVISKPDGSMEMFIWADDTNSWKKVPLGPTVEPSNSPLEMVVGIDADRASKTFPDGTLYFAEDTQKIYLYIAGKCVPFTSNNVSSGDIASSLDKIQETILLPAGQTLITLLKGSYVPNGDNIEVNVDGMNQPTSAYIELNDHQLEFKQAIDEDAIITVEYFAKII